MRALCLNHTSFVSSINQLRLQICLLSSPDVIKEKGLEHVTVDDLVAEITPKGRGKKTQSRHHNTLINIPTCIARVFWKQYCETAYVGCNTRKNVNIWILALNKTCKCKLSNSYSVFVMSCVCVDYYRLLFSHESVSIFMIALMLPRKLWVWGRVVSKFQFSF